MASSYKIGVASLDGIYVNCHFGRANKFYIYEVSEDGEIDFVELRHIVPVCAGGNHDNNLLETNVKRFLDCKYLIVARVGDGAMSIANSLGLEIHEIPGDIYESIEQLIKYKKVQELFN